MSVTKRAFLYVTRKKGKSVLLFAILLIMATFVLTGLSIWRASEAAQLDLRKSLGGRFDIGIDWENSPYVVKEMVQDHEFEEESGKTLSSYVMYSTKQFTQDEIAAIKQIEGVQYCDAKTEGLTSFEEVVLFPGTIPVEETYSHQTKIFGVWNSEDTELFTTGTLSLTEGKHIIPTDNHVAVISQDLAKESGLKLGDFITTHRYDAARKDHMGKEIRVQIIGLFTPKRIEAFGESITTYDKIQNRIFVDLQTAVDIENSPAVQGFDSVQVTINDPQEMERVVADVKALSMIDWDAFAVQIDNETYQSAAAPLGALKELTITLLAVFIVVSAVVLALILTLWTKTRIHEIGVFLSVGITKSAVMGQYLLEVLLIAIFAFGLSFFTSNAVADQIGNRLLEKSIQTETEDEEVTAAAASVEVGGDHLIQNPLPTETGLEVSVGFQNLVLLYLIGFGVIIVAVGASSMTVMRLRPREILSKMS